MLKLVGIAAISSLLLLSSVASAQQDGSVGMDEIDASVSAEGGDEFDARAAQEAANARLEETNRTLSDRLDDHEQRIRELEERLGQE